MLQLQHNWYILHNLLQYNGLVIDILLFDCIAILFHTMVWLYYAALISSCNTNDTHILVLYAAITFIVLRCSCSLPSILVASTSCQNRKRLNTLQEKNVSETPILPQHIHRKVRVLYAINSNNSAVNNHNAKQMAKR